MVDLGKAPSAAAAAADWQNEIGCWATGSAGSSTGLSGTYYPAAPNYAAPAAGYASTGGSPGGQDGKFETNKTLKVYRRTIMCKCYYQNDVCYTRLYDETAATAISSYSHTQLTGGATEYSTNSGDPVANYDLDANHEVYAQACGNAVDRVLAHIGLWEARLVDR